MQFNLIIWTVLCNSVSGAIIPGIQGHEKDNATQNTPSYSSNDYNTDYSEYTDRDYPNMDYYDDSREGRNFNHNHHNPSNDGGNFDEKDAEDFMMKQLRSTIPGTPGVDYALYQSVPETSFRCETQASPGFYGDIEAQCQVFHICQEDDRQDSFLCPLGTVFNQISFICDWWFNFNCEDTPSFYHLNDKYDSSTGSTFMKDTMRRMKKIHSNAMHNIMDLAKIKTKIHDMKEMMRNTDPAKLSKSPIKNLFMLGIRNKKFENIRKVMTIKREAEDFVTTLPVIKTPPALQAMSSTGHFDIELSEIKTSTSLDGFHEQLTLKTLDNATGNNNVPSTTVLPILNSTFNSLNLSKIEMKINGSISAEKKSDPNEISHNEISTTPESLSATTNTNILIKTKNISLLEMKTKQIDNKDNKFEDDFDSYLQSQFNSKLGTHVSSNETSVEDISLSNALLEKQSRPTILPLSKPFSHENRFIIGNDTHISVSVTIHAKPGNSKLQWKRLPGLKRIRKIRFNDENATSTPEKHAANDTIYIKKNNKQKSRSRIMWIPAKRNSLNRQLDWTSLFTSGTADTIDISKNEGKDMQTLNEFKKAALESSESPQITIKSEAYNSSDFETPLMNKSMENDLSEDSNTFQPTKYTENSFPLAITEEKFRQFNEASNFPDSNLENLTETQTDLKNNSNMYSEIENNCKTICIKLLKNLGKKSVKEIGNDTDFENLSSSIFLTSESSYTQNQDEYQRKSVLEFSPSEQWTLKYDSGPNCSENTEGDKILVKGWSVIIDIGSLTKEKTVKRRSCKSSSNDKRIVLKNFNFARNSRNENAAFDPKTSHPVMDSNSRFGSADQRYWINLVKNWLNQPQSSKNQEISNIKKNEDQIRHRSEYIHQKHLPERYQTNFNQGFDLNLEAESERIRVEDSVEGTLIPEYNKRRQQKVQYSIKTIGLPDLQIERSDLSQATQSRKDRLDIVSNQRDSIDYNAQDGNSDEIDQHVISDETDEDELAEDTRKRSSNFHNSQINRNFRMSKYQNLNKNSNMHNQWTDRTIRNANQNNDNWSSQERSGSRNWMSNRRDEEPHIKSEERDWSEKKQQNKKEPMALPERKKWNAEPSNDWLSDKPKISTSNTNKGFGPDFVDTTNDWSMGNRNKQGFGGDNRPPVSWQQDFDQTFSDERQKGRSPNSMSDGKGKSEQDVWSMIKDELKAYFMKKNQKDGWSLMKPQDTSWSADKTRPRKNDWTSDSKQNKPSLSPSSTKNKHSQTSKNDKASWSTGEENSWRSDSESKWIMENEKGDKEWRKPEAGGMRNRNDWYTEESVWNWDEQSIKKPPNKEWNLKSTPNKKKGISFGTDINSGDIPDWSSMPKAHLNRRYDTKGKEFPTKPSQKPPSWADDKEDNMWQAKLPRAEGWPSDHALNRMDFKGNSDSKKPRTTPTSEKSWSSNDRRKWKDDEEAWISDFAVNRPDQKQDKDISSKPRMRYPQWKSDFIDSGDWLKSNEKRTELQIPNNSKEAHFLQGTSRSDSSGTAKRRMTDWQNEPWKDSITITKDIKVADRNSYQPHGGRNNQRNEKMDALSWSMHGQTDSTLSGYGRASQKPNMNNYWGSSKDIKGSRTPESVSAIGNGQSKSANPRKNSTKNERNSDIVWSAQISNDGKLANGWIPITLRPDLKNRVNVSQTDRGNKRTSSKNNDWNNDKNGSSREEGADDKSKSYREKIWDNEEYFPGQQVENFAKGGNWRSSRQTQNNKRSSSMADRNRNKNGWNTENSFFLDERRNFRDGKMTNQYSNVPKNNQNTQVDNNAEIIEIDPLTIHTQEASFNHLIYIPPKSSRDKRSYKNEDRLKKIREAVNRSYIIIKNGKILNNTSKNNNKAVISKPNITVQNDKGFDKTSDASLDIQKFSFPNFTRAKRNSSMIKQNQTRILKRSDAIYETSAKHDTITKESIIKEIWSSPFISTNFSASGWIPVTTFKSFTNKNVSNLNKSEEITDVTHFQSKPDESILSTLASIPATNQLTGGGASKNLSAIAKDSNTKNKDKTESKNATNTAKSESVKEMKVGNKTLRILPFSDVMKGFQNQDKPSEDYKQDNKLRNKPITINPKTYSLKFNDSSKETATNFSNSWNFSSNENNTEKTLVLIRSNDNLDRNVKNNTDDQNPVNKDIDISAISASKINQLSNSTHSFSANKTYSNNLPQFKFKRWNANSNWTPIIRTMGRVISYNRTLLSK